MTFEYFYTKQCMDTLEVEDIGNCTIQALNDDGLIWYMVIQTSLGWTKIFEYGPCAPDFNELPKAVNCNFSRIDFDEKKVYKRIDEFLNNSFRKITQAFIVEEDTAWCDCKSIIEYMQDKNNF